MADTPKGSALFAECAVAFVSSSALTPKLISEV
jgi:hypothetical protein